MISTLRLIVPTVNTIELLRPSDVLYIEACQNYTKIILHNEKTILCNESLKTREEKMKLEDGFVRIRKSYIINVNHAVRYQRKGTIELKNGKKIPVSRQRKQEFLDQLRMIDNAKGE